MQGIRVVGGKMEATKTCAARWWKWIETPGLPCDGILILGQVEEKSGKVDEQTYGVETVPCSWPGGRSFAVRKLGAEIGGDDEMYTTSIGPGGKSVCTCSAGRARVEVCRHRDSLRAAILAGAVPPKRIEGA
jgi:hypothetical protein